MQWSNDRGQEGQGGPRDTGPVLIVVCLSLRESSERGTEGLVTSVPDLFVIAITSNQSQL